MGKGGRHGERSEEGGGGSCVGGRRRKEGINRQMETGQYLGRAPGVQHHLVIPAYEHVLVLFHQLSVAVLSQRDHRVQFHSYTHTHTGASWNSYLLTEADLCGRMISKVCKCDNISLPVLFLFTMTSCTFHAAERRLFTSEVDWSCLDVVIIYLINVSPLQPDILIYLHLLSYNVQSSSLLLYFFVLLLPTFELRLKG